MKIDRLIGILTILLRQDKTTIPELAERFEVSRRTISRDIEDLCQAGIPLVTMQGHGGGVSIADGYQIDRSLLTKDELEAIFAGLDGIDSVSKNMYSPGLAEKLSCSNSFTPASGPIRISLTAFDSDPITQKIDTIRAAIREKRLIVFRYYYSKGECLRTIKPHYLVYKWSAWYVWGYCLLREDFRTFKLDRLWELEVTDEHFTDTPVSEPWNDYDWFFASGKLHLRAWFSETAKYRLIEEYGPDCFIQLEKGGLLLERDFTSYDNMRQWVLSFGDQAEVFEPKQLRSDLLKQAKKLLKRYQDT